MIEDYMIRVILEADELNDKINKLEDKLINDKELEDKDLLIIQLCAMNTYSSTLQSRINRYVGKNTIKLDNE